MRAATTAILSLALLHNPAMVILTLLARLVDERVLVLVPLLVFVANIYPSVVLFAVAIILGQASRKLELRIGDELNDGVEAIVALAVAAISVI